MQIDCSQCGALCEVITDEGDVAYRCRCGVVAKWWKGDEGGPPATFVDVLNGALMEMEIRTEELRTILKHAESLRLEDDGQYFAGRLADAINGVERANQWLRWVKGKLKRFYDPPGDFTLFGPGGSPRELIDAAQEIERVRREPE